MSKGVLETAIAGSQECCRPQAHWRERSPERARPTPPQQSLGRNWLGDFWASKHDVLLTVSDFHSR